MESLWVNHFLLNPYLLQTNEISSKKQLSSYSTDLLNPQRLTEKDCWFGVFASL